MRIVRWIAVIISGLLLIMECMNLVMHSPQFNVSVTIFWFVVFAVALHFERRSEKRGDN